VGFAHTYEKQRFSTSASKEGLLTVNERGNAELDEVLRNPIPNQAVQGDKNGARCKQDKKSEHFRREFTNRKRARKRGA
jgi:hypothetical protein